MTDEPREENQPEPEDVEAHGPIGLPPTSDKNRGEDEDVEAHGPIGLPAIGEPPVN